MNVLARIGFSALAAATLTASLIIPGRADGDLLARMARVNPHLKSYTASVHADVSMRTFPYLSPSLDGMYYHKEPNKDKLVFTSGLPAIAKEFSKIYPHLESPARWNAVYVVTVESDQGGITTLKLVPRSPGRVANIEAQVDDRRATVIGMRWNYIEGGGYATLDQQYISYRGNYLVSQQSGHVEIPNYTADVKSKFGRFKLNQNIPDSVFAGE
ncbi:MAG: hypothetical protein M3Z07_02720 [Candidatus Eremiobacteraeota bacterium]|nr:hypothetical protein [Candidatus Eremiobacteraeota bacterium]